MIAVVELTEATRTAWDAYVRSAPAGLALHLSGWREVLVKTGGYETCYLMAREGERVVGVLPLFFVRSVLVGNTAMTLPGGLCADDAAAAAALIREGLARARLSAMRRLVLQDGRDAWPAGLATRSDHVHWQVDVSMSTEALWSHLHRNVRRQVRMARSNGLTVEIDRSGRALDAFYDVFSRFTHEAGTPVYSRQFLANVVEAFPDGFNIALVHHEGKAIGGFFQLEMGQRMLGMWGATLHAYLELRPNYLAYWSLLEDAAQRGFAFLDMGRSPASSNASAFKGQWGGECLPVYRQQLSLGAGAGAVQGQAADTTRPSQRMQLVTRLWPKLPLPLATYLGPKLRHHVPFG